jgi:glycerol-3-phosphate dehydrogenase
MVPIMNRTDNVKRLLSEEFDVLVIGGGAVGCGCAVDAQLRGMKTALIERDDFGAGTSGRSTKLVHGGIRYLEHAVKKLSRRQFQLVRTALGERWTMLQSAPHLVRPISFIVPVYSGFQKLYYRTGIRVYDIIAGKSCICRSTTLSRRETLDLCPMLNDEGLEGAIRFWDGQFDDSRYNVMLAQTASDMGVVIANHVRLTGFEMKQGRFSRAIALDDLSRNEIRIGARVFINAAGPFSDIVRSMADGEAQPLLRHSKGVHIVVSSEVLPIEQALLIPKTDDGRILFAIPYLGKVIIGTTDTEVGVPESNPGVTYGESMFLLQHINKYLKVKLEMRHIQSSFAGFRPLLASGGQKTVKLLNRDYLVDVDHTGLVSIMGGEMDHI